MKSINQDLLTQLQALEQETEAAQRKIESLNVLRIWENISLKASSMTFALVGACPKGCISVSCKVMSSNVVRLDSRIETGLFKDNQRSKFKQLKPIMNFVEVRTVSLCSSINMNELSHPNCIASYLRNIEWKFARIQEIAAELVLIRNRYRTTLVQVVGPTTTTSDFNLIVRFGSSLKRTVITASFLVSETYIFSSNIVLDIVVDDDQKEREAETKQQLLDIETIQKLLRKRTKQGFGYLSRACGILSAFAESTGTSTIKTLT